MIDPAELEGLAAEFALGTLDQDEHEEIARLRRADPVLDDQIRQWEKRFEPLLGKGPSEAPDPTLRASILGRIAAAEGTRGSEVRGELLTFRRRVRFWRGATAVAGALAAALAIWIAAGPSLIRSEPPKRYVAVLDQGPDHASFVVSLDLARHVMTVAPSSTQSEAGKDYELWMIGADQSPPISLGVISAKQAMSPRWPTGEAAELRQATYAVTLEQKGGSPTGQPTSKPLFVGRIIDTGSL